MYVYNGQIENIIVHIFIINDLIYEYHLTLFQVSAIPPVTFKVLPIML